MRASAGELIGEVGAAANLRCSVLNAFVHPVALLSAARADKALVWLLSLARAGADSHDIARRGRVCNFGARGHLRLLPRGLASGGAGGSQNRNGLKHHGAACVVAQVEGFAVRDDGLVLHGGQLRREHGVRGG